MGIGDGIPASLCCPITTAFIENPVIAKDGYTYERTHIEQWFRSKPTSPMTNLAISKSLITNQNIKASIDVYVLERARELQRKEQNAGILPLALDATCQGTKDMGPVKSLAELAGMFREARRHAGITGRDARGLGSAENCGCGVRELWEELCVGALDDDPAPAA